MKIINVNLNDERGEIVPNITILPIADCHIGDKLANLKLLKEALERIKNEPNTYTIINGDLMNNALKNSKSDVYSDYISPMEQVIQVIELLEPIKDKILVLSSGNHEDRTTKETNIDVLRLVAKQLHLEDRYANGWWYLYLRFGEKRTGRKAPMVYTVTGIHGYGGGGRRPGGKINTLEDMSRVVIADIYMMGHTHKPIGTKGRILLPDYANNAITAKDLYYLMTNSFVEYDGGYAEKMGMPPSNTSLVEAQLDGEKRKIKILL